MLWVLMVAFLIKTLKMILTALTISAELNYAKCLVLLRKSACYDNLRLAATSIPEISTNSRVPDDHDWQVLIYTATELAHPEGPYSAP